MLKQLRARYTYEDLFLERYDQLLAWAVCLTDRDLQQAEDLVHDVFVKFALTQPDMHRIENLDAYLYTSLRNTYRSHLRRAGYGAVRQLNLLDYDSAELGLRWVEHRHAFQTQEELRLICRYGCLRKETAKAGSVLILRYFLGYFPSEIAKILKSKRQAVAELLRVARVEARLFVHDPNRLSFVDQDQDSEPMRINGALTTQDLLVVLWNQIFSARSGDCLSRTQLREEYLNAGDQAIDRRILAHLVSCPRCLDEVNRILGVPLLADRNPTDSTGPDPESRGGMGNGGAQGGSNEALKRVRRRVKQVYEHDPKELRIVINGQLLGSQEINAEVNKQTLSLNQIEPITFIEVYSEQEIRFTYLVIEDLPIGKFEQREVVRLSDERKIEISLNFKGVRPELQVIHYHPFFPEESVPSLSLSGKNAEIVESEGGSNLNRLLEWFSQWFNRLTIRPRGVVAGAVILIAAWLILNHTGKPTAASLLGQAVVAEASFRQAVAREPDQVFHRTIELEEMRSDNSVVAHRRIEIWQNARKQLDVRRLYDENGHLIAGEVKKSNRGDLRFKQMPTLDDLWQLDLSAKEFAVFVGNLEGGIVEETPRTYVISYRNPSAGLVEASLTIDRRDRHAIEQRFIFRYTNEDRVMRFVEKNFERRPLDATIEPVFKVESELRGATTKQGSAVISSQAISIASLSPGNQIGTAAGLEVKALTLLHQIGADLGEEVSLTRSRDGKLKVEAIVETSQRKNEILDALSPIARHPAALIRIETVAEALRRKPGKTQPSTQLLIQEYDATALAIPAQSELRSYFKHKLASALPGRTAEETLDAEIQKFATKMLKQSQKALLRAYALKRLAGRFSNEELRRLNAEGRAEWLSLIAEHARRLSIETGAMHTELQPILENAGASVAGDDQSSVDLQIKDDPDLQVAIKRLFELETAVDRKVRSAFIASTQAAAVGSVKMVQLWIDLLRAEKLAVEIQKKSSGNSNR